MKITKKEASFITMCIEVADDELQYMSYEKDKADLYQRLCAFASFGESNKGEIMDKVSNCCGALPTGETHDDLGFCSNCREHAVFEEEELECT